MLNIKFGTENFLIRNEFDEITITEFEEISTIVNNPDLDLIEQYHAIFLLVGVKESDLDNVSLEEFMHIIGKWEVRQPLPEFIRTINIGDIEYFAYDESKPFKFTLKIIRDINKIANEGLTYAKILAIIFKEKDNQTPGTFEEKTLLFTDIKCSVGLPYILRYNEEIKNSLNSFQKC